MKFTKMQGCGNDYVVMDARQPELEGRRRGEMARALCDRHYGIGADGLLLLKEGKVAPFEMEMYNPDGSRGESCGNGLRCAGKYLWEKGWTRADRFGIETMGSVKRLERLETCRWMPDVGEESLWRVDVGEAVFPEKGLSLIIKTKGLPRGVNGSWEVHPVSVGNPHAVLFMEKGEPGEWPVDALGPAIENAGQFPGRTNVEFVKVTGRGEIIMRVWERGAGETLSCGTGACAAAAVCMQKHLTDDEITVKLLGGELIVSKEECTGRFLLTGPAVTTFEGEILI